jgi:hypothetical protein
MGVSNPFEETRRVLAARNATSSFVGTAYESYVRSLFVKAGFRVATGRVLLRNQGRPVTDVDVLAYKDGLLFLVQAKCLVEPDSVHSLWKAQHHIDAAVRQCLVGRAHLQYSLDALGAMPVAPEEVRELVCAVVSPAIRFRGDCVWPVAVVDDMYLDHVLNVGVVSNVNANGETVETRRLYPGAQPTGPELRDLLLSPAPLRALHSGGGGLRAFDYRIGDLTLTEFWGSDGNDMLF